MEIRRFWTGRILHNISGWGRGVSKLMHRHCMQGREKFSMTENAEMRGVGLHA
jgi:hypothetical protein